MTKVNTYSLQDEILWSRILNRINIFLIIEKKSYVSLLLTQILAQKQCPTNHRCEEDGLNDVWKKCRDIFPDVIAQTNQDKEDINPQSNVRSIGKGFDVEILLSLTLTASCKAN